VLKAPPLKKFLKPGLDVRFTSNSFTILNINLAGGVSTAACVYLSHTQHFGNC
jgi:hypothetical protein